MHVYLSTSLSPYTNMVDEQLEITNLYLLNPLDNSYKNVLSSIMNELPTVTDNYINFNKTIIEEPLKQIYIPTNDVETQTISAIEDRSVQATISIRENTTQTLDIPDDKINIIMIDENIQSFIEQNDKCVSPFHAISTEQQPEMFQAPSLNENSTQTDNVEIFNSLQFTDDNEQIFNKYLDKNIITNGETHVHLHRNVIIDNSTKHNSIYLEDGFENEIKYLYLAHANMYDSIVHTSCGSFVIDIHEMNKIIIFNNKRWHILGKCNNFLPSDQLQSYSCDEELCSFGSSNTISGNGNVCYIGGYSYHNCLGKIWVFNKTIDGWIKVNEIIPNIPDINSGSHSESNNSNIVFWGISLSTNFDGSVVAIGGTGYNDFNGACWVYKNNQFSQLLTNDINSIANNCVNIDSRNIDVNKCNTYFGLNILLSHDSDNLLISDKTHVYHYHYDEKYILQQIINLAVQSLTMTPLCETFALVTSSNIYIDEHRLFKDNTIIIHDAQLITPRKCIVLLNNHIKDDLFLLSNGIHGSNSIDGAHTWTIKYIFSNISEFKYDKLLKCHTCSNGRTIIIVGITNNNYIAWCFRKQNKKWILHNTKLLFVQTAIYDIHLQMSRDGRSVIISCPDYDNYSGVCWFYS